ncbi:MAG: sulfatase-like hydrolase/transferase [Candidatus Poribacteria bacterium]
MKRHSPVVAILLFALCFTSCFEAADQQRPNIVLILCDDLGFSDLGCYGGEIRTPNLDRLASQGMKFTQFYNCAVCVTTRAALITGLHPRRRNRRLLHSDMTTLAEVLRSAGYRTSLTGKWHLGSDEESQPQNQGFDEWRFGFFGTTEATLYGESMSQTQAPEKWKALIPKIIEADHAGGTIKIIRDYDLEYRQFIDRDIAGSASRYIKRQAKSDAPFFLFVGWTRPHYPNIAAPDYAGKSRIGTYGDSVMELDGRTGEVLTAVSEAGIEDSTIVIFISDNGPTKTSGSISEINNGSAGPWRGELGDALEGSIRTVGMIRWPGKISPGVTNEMIAIHDFLPTLAKIIGAEIPTDRPIDGVDQSAFFLGYQQNSNREHLLTFIGDRLVAVRYRQWRMYPVSFDSTDGTATTGGYLGRIGETAGLPEVYNIEADPREERNVGAENGWVIVPYLQLIGAYKKSLEMHPNPPAANLTNF